MILSQSVFIISSEGPFTTDILLLLNPLAYPNDLTISFYPYLWWSYKASQYNFLKLEKAAMAKVHCDKWKVKCQVASNFFYITNSRIRIEYSFLPF